MDILNSIKVIHHQIINYQFNHNCKFLNLFIALINSLNESYMINLLIKSIQNLNLYFVYLLFTIITQYFKIHLEIIFQFQYSLIKTIH